jgi:type IV pilus assembly protein PilM
MGLPFTGSKSKKREQVLAIDLGSRSTKAVQMERRNGKLALVSYAFADAPSADRAPSVDMLTEHLKEVYRLLGNGRAKQVTLAVGVGDTLFRQTDVPQMPVADVRLMLKHNSKTYLQQDLPDYVYDCCFVATRVVAKSGEAPKASGPQKQRVFIGGAKRKTIEDLNAAIKGAGLVPDQVVPGIIGPVNAFELAEPEVFAKDSIALVDVGFRNTTIMILDGGELALNRVVALGGDRMTTGLAETLSIQYTEAEQIKLGMADEVLPHLEPVLHPLGRELRASIDFFEHQNDKTVTQVFFSGGSARSDHIIQILQTELMVPCKSWNPVTPLQVALRPELVGEVEHVAPQLTVAIGAAASAF